MSAFLSGEWLTEARLALADLPEIDGVNAIVQYTITGAPDGKVQVHVVVRSGRVASIEAGRHDEPDCTVSLAYPEAVALFSGDVTPEVAFMSGRAKVEGDHRVWLLDLRAVRAGEAMAAALASLRKTTTT
jgi:putative sterol carrier protein